MEITLSNDAWIKVLDMSEEDLRGRKIKFYEDPLSPLIEGTILSKIPLAGLMVRWDDGFTSRINIGKRIAGISDAKLPEWIVRGFEKDRRDWNEKT